MVIIATAAQMGESAGRNDWRVLRADEGIAAAFESSSTCAWAGEQEHSIFFSHEKLVFSWLFDISDNFPGNLDDLFDLRIRVRR